MSCYVLLLIRVVGESRVPLGSFSRVAYGVTFCRVMLGNVLLCRVILCRVMFCYEML